MNKKKNKALVIFILIVVLLSLSATIFKMNEVYALSKYGSTGEEVKQIQTKLKNWGYYKGSIDGIYGSKTVNAVKDFQNKNGLNVDGIVGDKTLAALGINPSGNNSNNTRK